MQKNKKKMVHKMYQKCKEHLRKCKKAILIGGVILLLFGAISPALNQAGKISMLAQENIPSPPPNNGPLPGEPSPGEPMPGEPMPGEPMPGEPMPGEPSPVEPMSIEPTPGELDPKGEWNMEDPCKEPEGYNEAGEPIFAPECQHDESMEKWENGDRDREDEKLGEDRGSEEDEYRDWEKTEGEKWEKDEFRIDENEKKNMQREMKRRMRDIKYMERDLKRMEKDFDRMAKRDGERIGIADIKELKVIFAEYKKAAKAKMEKLEKLPSKFEEAVREDNRRIFWDYFEEMNRSGEDLLIESLRPKMDFFWRIQHFNDFGWEILKIEGELARVAEESGIDLEELKKEIGLDELVKIKEDIDVAIAAVAEKLTDLDETVAQCLEDFKEHKDDEDFWMIREDCWFELEDTRENMWMGLDDLDWKMQDNWEKMERIHQKMGWIHEKYFMMEMIEEIKKGMKNVVRKLEEAEEQYPNVSFDRQWKLIAKGKELLQQIQDKLERGEMEALHEIMPKFDRLGFEVEKAFRKLCEKKNICLDPFEGVPRPGGGPQGMFDRGAQIDSTIGKIGIGKGENLKDIIGRASEEDVTLILQLILDLRPTALDNLIEKAEGKYEDRVAKSLERIQYIPEDKQNDFLEMKGTLLDAVNSLEEKVEELDEEKIVLPSDVRKIEEIQDALASKDFVSSEAVEELNTKVDEFIAADFDTKEEVSEKIMELDQKLEEATNKDEDEKYKLGVNPSKDVDLDDWFHKFVKKGMDKEKFSGYKDESGNLLGEFRPGNNVNKGEILKMAIENAGVKPEMTEPLDDIAGIEYFWGPEYVSTGRHLGLKVAWEIHSIDDLGASATRGEVIRTVLEASGFKEEMIKSEVDDATDFTDLPGDHPDFAFIEYAYENEVISGDTDASGNPLHTVRPWDSINRAETAKILETVESTIEYEVSTGEVPAVEEEKRGYEEFFDKYEFEIDFENIDFENFDMRKGPEGGGGGGGGEGPKPYEKELEEKGLEEEEEWEEEFEGEWEEEFEGAVMTVVII